MNYHSLDIDQLETNKSNKLDIFIE
jgi:hypothetical protein